MKYEDTKFAVEAKDDYFHIIHKCGQACDIELSRWDGAVPWIKITCPTHGKIELKLWKASLSSAFIKKMHGLNP